MRHELRDEPSPSARDNALSALVAAAALVGVALGLWLPWETWRSGDEVVLGDFALLCLFAVTARDLLGPASRRWGRWTALGAVVGVLALREWAWRHQSEVLGVLHGVAVAVSVVVLVAPPLFDLADLRRGVARTWSVDASVSLTVGITLVIWWLWALV